MSFFSRLRVALKAFTDPTFWTASDVWDRGRLPGSDYDYGRDLRQGLYSNVVMAPVQWIMRNFTEADPVVERRVDGRWQEVVDHQATILLERPNAFYDGDTLWKGTLISFLLDGNAYWLKRRSDFGNVVELWYIPHWSIKPVASGTTGEFIDHYEYKSTGQLHELDPRDVVHYRFGLDPEDPKRGWSPLRSLLREVFTDDEAANFTASILRNMGIPGLLISPKDGKVRASPEDVERTKNYIEGMFTGDRRGKPLALGAPTEVQQFGHNPQAMDVANLRDIAEERVCAALGLPAAVVGFGAGLQSTKVGATMREMRRLAWVQSLIPMQRSLGRQLSMQLLPDYHAQLRRYRIRFDTSGVSAFAEEETEKADRLGLLVTRGVLRVDRAQEMLGLEVDETQAVYLRPSNAVAIESDGTAAVMENGNGNGNGDGEDGALVDQSFRNRLAPANAR